MPIVVLTGSDDPALETELVRRGVQEYLLKDEIAPRTLGRTIRHAIERSRILLDRRRVEEALRCSESNLRALIEATPQMILVHQDGLIQYANPASVDLLGVSERAELLGRPLLDFVHIDDRAIAEEIVRGAGRSRDAQPGRDLRLERADGVVLDTEAVMIEIDFGELGEFSSGSSVLMVARDLSERKRVQARAIQADRAAALGIFAAGMAHEINNPLSYVIGNLDYLAEEVPALVDGLERLGSHGADPDALGEIAKHALQRSADLRETIQDAREGADRVRSLVADLKVLSRPADQPSSCADAEAILESVMRLMGAELRSRARIVRAYERVRPVSADPARLAQVFLCLLTNAVHALPTHSPGRNEIRLAIASTDPGQVRIEVRDNGRGMSPRVMKRVFDPFYTTEEPGRGSGLGLAICQNIVGELGGEISVESREGEGTAFGVTLPVA
jgi:PAS domain S-box-containing protein